MMTKKEAEELLERFNYCLIHKKPKRAVETRHCRDCWPQTYYVCDLCHQDSELYHQHQIDDAIAVLERRNP